MNSTLHSLLLTNHENDEPVASCTVALVVPNSHGLSASDKSRDLVYGGFKGKGEKNKKALFSSMLYVNIVQRKLPNLFA